MQNILKPQYRKLNQAIKSAGSIIMQYFSKQLQLTYKSTPADYRTPADIEAEKTIIRAIMMESKCMILRPENLLPWKPVPK